MDEIELVRRVELVRTQQEARTAIYRGATLIGLAPVVSIVSIVAALALRGFPSFLAVLCGLVYLLVGGVAGVAMIASGAVEHRRTTRALRMLDEAHQLPAARVIER